MGWKLVAVDEDERTRIELDIERDGESVRGTASDGASPERSFSGWLGLAGAIDGLLPWRSSDRDATLSKRQEEP